MATEAQYVDTSDMEETGEAFEMDSEQAPSGGFTPTLPGFYDNPSRILVPKIEVVGEEKREHLVRREKDGHFGFLFKLVGGLEKDGRVTDTKYPHTVYVSTRLRDVMDFSQRPPVPRKKADGTTLQVSDLNRYLRLAGVDPKGLRLTKGPDGLYTGSLLDAVISTLNTTVGGKVGWRERTEATGELTPDGKKKYGQSHLRTRDFQTGTVDGEPVYSPEVTGFLEEKVSARGKTYKVFKADPDGETFKAQAFVEYFTKPSAASADDADIPF